MIMRRLIIMCEECGDVRHFDASSEQQVEDLYKRFICSNKCDRSFYSYITIGEIEINQYSRQVSQAVPSPGH